MANVNARQIGCHKAIACEASSARLVKCLRRERQEAIYNDPVGPLQHKAEGSLMVRAGCLRRRRRDPARQRPPSRTSLRRGEWSTAAAPAAALE